jgi:toxin ParE1/3/4
MARIILRPAADEEIDEIAARIARDNLRAAHKFLDAVYDAFDLLVAWPRIGTRRSAKHPSLKGLRSYPIPRFRDYLIFYLPVEGGIEVAHVTHGSRDLPALLRRG